MFASPRLFLFVFTIQPIVVCLCCKFIWTDLHTSCICIYYIYIVKAMPCSIPPRNTHTTPTSKHLSAIFHIYITHLYITYCIFVYITQNVCKYFYIFIYTIPIHVTKTIIIYIPTSTSYMFPESILQPTLPPQYFPSLQRQLRDGFGRRLRGTGGGSSDSSLSLVLELGSQYRGDSNF